MTGENELARIINLVKSLEGDIYQKIYAEIEDTLKIMEEDAKSLVPVCSGELRDSIRAYTTGDGENIEAILTAEADYAPCVELGTLGRPARPFLYPAFEKNKGRLSAYGKFMR